MAGTPEPDEPPEAVAARWFTLKQFYADERRRRSEERSFGAHRRDAETGREQQVVWIRDTGELALVAPMPGAGDALSLGGDAGFVDAFLVTPLIELGLAGLLGLAGRSRTPATEVEVVAVIPDEAAVDALLDGWEDARTGPDGIGWLLDRIGDRPDDAVS